jgi:hypothetical protein
MLMMMVMMIILMMMMMAVVIVMMSMSMSKMMIIMIIIMMMFYESLTYVVRLERAASRDEHMLLRINHDDITVVPVVDALPGLGA